MLIKFQMSSFKDFLFTVPKSRIENQMPPHYPSHYDYGDILDTEDGYIPPPPPVPETSVGAILIVVAIMILIILGVVVIAFVCGKLTESL